MASPEHKNQNLENKTSRTGRQPPSEGRRLFPESSSSWQQLRLLLQGLSPVVQQKLSGGTCRLHELWRNFTARLRMLPTPRRVHAAVFLTASLAVAVYSVYTVRYTTATTVTFDGVELGTVASENEAQAARMSVEQAISAVLGYDYTMEDDRVAYTTGLTARSALVDEAELEEALSSTLRVVEHGYALYIGGEFIGATQTEGAFDALLDQVAAPYRSENTVSIDFLEDVELRE